MIFLLQISLEMSNLSQDGVNIVYSAFEIIKTNYLRTLSFLKYGKISKTSREKSILVNRGVNISNYSGIELPYATVTHVRHTDIQTEEIL